MTAEYCGLGACARFLVSIAPGLAVAAVLLAASTTVRAASPSAHLDAGHAALVIRSEKNELRLSLASPEFVFADETIGPQLPQKGISADVLSGKRVEVTYPPVALKGGGSLEIRLSLQWSARESVLRKWASYRLTGAATEPVLKEVILEKLPQEQAAGKPKISFSLSPPQSVPAFWDGFFAGIEFPVASSRIENGNLVLAHMPGLRVKSGIWYETRKAVYGVARAGDERQAFRRYIEFHHPSPKGLHISYNSWWTSPVPYKEADINGLMGVFEQKLVKPHGAHFDTFCIDMGWSAAKSVWGIDKQLFPQGFGGIEATAKRMHCNLGLWVSPSSCYSPAMDNEWAEKNGYETFAVDSRYQSRRACLAGVRYRTALTQRLVEYVTNYGVRQIKLDGYSFDCPAANHGHEPGALSTEAVAEGFTTVMQAVRKACPDVWLEPTCFGRNPSPWWLFYANSVTGFFGDDAPYGRVPSPVYRESYTSARDYFNLQGCALLSLPVSGQDTLGIVHQSPEPFSNDAVMCVMRGNMFLPVYVNPRFMTDARWKALAGILNWARKNARTLSATQPLLPATWQKNGVPPFSYTDEMPREPYGYAHWGKNWGLVVLRNPWIVPQTYSLKLDGFSLGAKGISAVSLYPEARLYAKGLKSGDTVKVSLAPYETIVLSVAAGQSVSGLADAAGEVGHQVESTVRKNKMKPSGDSVELKLEADVSVHCPQAQLLILLEDKKTVPNKPMCRVSVNGKDQAVGTRASIDACHAVDDETEIGWAASSLPAIEHWRFLTAPLTKGKSSVSVELTASGSSRVSAWVWATKPGGPTSAYPNALPQPEVISLDGAQLLAPTPGDH
jgi:hypothetical protein